MGLLVVFVVVGCLCSGWFFSSCKGCSCHGGAVTCGGGGCGGLWLLQWWLWQVERW